MFTIENVENKGGLPAGTVTNTPQGKAALQRIGAMNLDPGESADAIQGQHASTDVVEPEQYVDLNKEAGFIGKAKNFMGRVAGKGDAYRSRSVDMLDRAAMQSESAAGLNARGIKDRVNLFMHNVSGADKVYSTMRKEMADDAMKTVTEYRGKALEHRRAMIEAPSVNEYGSRAGLNTKDYHYDRARMYEGFAKDHKVHVDHNLAEAKVIDDEIYKARVQLGVGAGVAGTAALGYGAYKAHEAFSDKVASFRSDYRVPSTDPRDTSKQEAYMKENKTLLSKHKWMPNIKAILEGEVKAVSKDLTVLKDGIKMEKDMQGAELNKVRAEAKSKMMKKKAGISGKDYNAIAANAIPDFNAAAAKIDNVFGTFIDKATNFSKNVIGRHHEQYDLNKAIGGISAHTEHMTPGSFHHGVNTKLLEDKTKELADLRATVRTDRTNAALVGAVGTGAVMTINDEMQRRKQYKYASVVPGTEGSHTTYQLSTERGNIAGDALHAVETINQEPSHTKKKFLAAAAVAAISAGGLVYGAKQLASHPEIMHMTTASGRAGMEMGKAVAEVLPYVTGVGGAYYAYQNRDNATKRNIGLGVAGLSAATRYAMPKPLDIGTAPDVAGRARALATASSVGFLGSVGYAAHKGQEIANHEAIEGAMHSGAPIEEVTHTVNTIRGKHSLATRYPITRYLHVPSAVTRLFNSKMGVPAGAMNNDDRAYYYEAQVDAEFEKLKKRYEANLGKLNHAGHTDLRELAIKNVNERGA